MLKPFYRNKSTAHKRCQSRCKHRTALNHESEDSPHENSNVASQPGEVWDVRIYGLLGHVSNSAWVGSVFLEYLHAMCIPCNSEWSNLTMKMRQADRIARDIPNKMNPIPMSLMDSRLNRKEHFSRFFSWSCKDLI